MPEADRGFGAVLVALGAAAIVLVRERSVALIALALLAAVPLATARWEDRRRRTLTSGALVLLTFALPWTNVDRFTVCLAIPLLFWFDQPMARCQIAGSTLLVLAGFVPLESTFVLISAGWVTALTAWLWLKHRALVARRQAVRRWRIADGSRLAIQLAIAALVGGGCATLLPALEHWVVERAAGIVPRTSGFGNATNLNTVDSIQQSSRLVMRIYDPGPYLMRGHVYTTYNRGIWRTAFLEQAAMIGEAPAAGAPIRVASMVEADRVLFLPAEWQAVRCEGNPASLDWARIPHTRDSASHWSFRCGKAPERRPDPLSAEHRAACLEVPDEVRAALAPLLGSIVRPGRAPRQVAGDVLFALEERCAYTLSPGMPQPGQEPVVRFLMETRNGHCEYFASAMALLLRLAGIPSRYVGGFSAVERNPFGGFLMARDQDAHAWCEAYIDGEGWTTWDATPAVWRKDLEATKSPLSERLSQLVDWLQERWDAFYEWFVAVVVHPLGDLLASPLGAPLAVLLGALIATAVWWRRLLAQLFGLLALLAAFRGAAAAAPDELGEGRGAARALTRLEALLAPHGIHRASSATPAELVQRLAPGVVADEARDAAREVVDLFCRSRYGGVAWDAARADACLARLERELTKGPPAR